MLGRHLLVWSQLEHNPVPGLVFDLPTFGVSILLHESLCLEKFLTDGTECLLVVDQHIVNGIHLRNPGDVFWKIKWFPTKGDFIWCGTSTCIP